MKRIWIWVVAFVLGMSRLEAAEEFFLDNNDTVLFLGDSNTYADDYIKYLDAYFFTRFPKASFQLINRGMPSETVAGTSEASHVPPRPDLHTRLDGVLASVRADVIVACYGMNDGIYISPNAEVFSKYQTGVKRLIQRLQDDSEASIVLMPPPTFDATPFLDKPAVTPPDWRRPASDYDSTLEEFSKWLLTLESQEVQVIDLHTPMKNHLKARREKDPNFILAGDGIHFNATGHMIVALQILEKWKAQPKIAEAKFDWTEIQAVTSNPRIIEKAKDALIFEWTLPLPMPVDPQWVMKSVELERFAERINLLPLQIVDLPPGNYRLTIDRAVIAQFTKEELEKGVNLASLSLFPPSIKSLEALKLVKERRQVMLEFWVKNEPHPRLAGMHKKSSATLEQAQALEKQIRRLCEPRIYKFEILKVN